MRSIPRFWLPVLALLLGAPAGAAPQLVRTLPCKVTLVTREVRTRPLVSLQAWVRVGGRDESPTERGCSAVLAEEMFSATTTRERGQMEKEITSIGGTLGIEAGYGFTIYTITVPTRSLNLAIDCMSDALMHTKIDSRFLEQGMGKAQRESRTDLGTPERASINDVRAALWAGTPLAAPFAVPEIEIRGVTATVLDRFYREHYVAENLTVVAVGDVDSEDLAGRIDKAFSGMPHGKAAAPSPIKASPIAGPKAVAVKNPAGTAGEAVTVGFRAPSWGSADALALDVLLALLVDSPDARFPAKLGDKAIEFTAASAYRTFEAEGGSMTISLTAAPGRLVDAEAVLLGEIEKVKGTPITAKELDSAVRTVLARDLLPQADLGPLGRAVVLACYQGKPGAEEVYAERLQAIRPADLVAVARKYLDLKQSVFVEMAPDSVLKVLNASGDIGRRIAEKASIASAAYRSGPSVLASSDADRRARIDAPLAKIPATPVESGRGRVDTATLPGGLRLLTSEDWSAPVATVAVYMLGGVRYETEETNGLTALGEEVLLNCDDPKHPGNTYRMTLQKMGRFVPYQDRDMWGYSISVPASSAPEAIDLLADMLTRAKTDSVSVDASRISVLTALDRWREDDETQRHRLIFPTKYHVSGYRLPGLGTRRNLMTFPQTTLEGFYKKFVVRPNVVVSVFGAVRSADARAAVEQSFRDLPSRPFSPGTLAQEGEFTDFREQWDLGAGPNCTVTIAFNGPRASSPDMPALYVVNSLFSGPKGWFPQYLLSVQGITDATSIVAQAVDESPLIASVTTDGPGYEETGAKLLFRQFKKVALLPLVGQLDADLVNARRHAVGSYLMLFTTNTARAFQWSRAQLFGLPSDYPLTLPAKMDAVGAADLTSVGLKYFQKDDWNRQPYAVSETRPGGW